MAKSNFHQLWDAAVTGNPAQLDMATSLGVHLKAEGTHNVYYLSI